MGVPLRLGIEIGPNYLAKQQILSARHDIGAKAPIALANLAATVPQLETIHRDMDTTALNEYNSHLKEVTRWEDAPDAGQQVHCCHSLTREEACEDVDREYSLGDFLTTKIALCGRGRSVDIFVNHASTPFR